MVCRQPMLWVIQPADVRSNVSAVAQRLGIDKDAAITIVERMPVVLALESGWLQLR